MAEYGEWTQKGATLSDVTAEKEYGVSREFIVEGIKTTVPFHQKLMQNEDFRKGNFNTSFINTFDWK